MYFAIHMALHILLPAVAARLFYAQRWLSVWVMLLATMLVDLDHLLADPLFDPQRCSIGFHPLHSDYAIATYLIMMGFPRLRIIALGLLIHMAIDGADCMMM